MATAQRCHLAHLVVFVSLLSGPGAPQQTDAPRFQHLSRVPGILPGHASQMEPAPEPAPEPRIVTLAIGHSVQAAIDAAEPGTVIALEPGVWPQLTASLRLRPDAGGVTITTAGSFPSGRISPEERGTLAELHAPAAAPVIRADPGASGYVLSNLVLVGAADRAIVELGDGSARELAEVPREIDLRRLLLIGHERGSRRAVALNSAHTTIEGIHTSRIWSPAGADSQAIGGWAGPGPYVIRNSYLEAVSENIMFGGATTHIAGLVPSDILIEGNDLPKRPEWRGDGVRHAVKNHFELKNGRRVTFRRNRLLNLWAGGQAGWSIVLTPAPEGSAMPWAVVEDVLIEGNEIRNVGGVVNAMGTHTTGAPVEGNRRVTVRNNVAHEIQSQLGAHGTFAQVMDGCEDYVFEGNLIDHNGNQVMLFSGGRPITGLQWRGNVHSQGHYGIFGSGGYIGEAALDRYAPGAIVLGNRVADRPAGGTRWPARDTKMERIPLDQWPAVWHAAVEAWGRVWSRAAAEPRPSP